MCGCFFVRISVIMFHVEQLFFLSAQVYVVLLAVSESFYGVFGDRKAVILAEFVYIRVYYLVTCYGGWRFVYGVVVAEIFVVVGYVGKIGVFLEH